MGILIGYMANRADRLADALHQEREALVLAAEGSPSGWGLGFYQGGEVLHKKRRVLEGRELDWTQVANSVQSDCAVIHVRQATVGDFRAENTHPFRMRSWLFAHSGTIHRFGALRERLLQTMPDFIRRSIRGETDSEHFFHAILSFLHDSGQLDRPSQDPGPVLAAIRAAVRLVDRLSREVEAEPASLNFILTDGRAMYALRRGRPLFLVRREGIHDPLDPDAAGAQGVHTLRYVLVESSDGGPMAGYQEVDNEQVCVVSRELEVSFHAL